MKRVVMFALGIITSALCACGTTTIGGVARGSLADCPDALKEAVHVAASASATVLPNGVAELAARRLMFSATLRQDMPVRGSRLTITPVGGTFAGYVGVLPGRAVDVIPGRLRIEPLLSSSRDHSETLAVDVTLVPGGEPADKLIAQFSPLWTDDGHPAPPQSVQVSISSQRHDTVFDSVEANATLDVDVAGTTRCSYETRFTMVDHESVLPSLWDLHTLPRDGKRKRWLALFETSMGPTRVVLGDVRMASALANWLRATGATRVGKYQLGLFEGDEERGRATLPGDHDIASHYLPATVEEVQALAVGRVGEN